MTDRRSSDYDQTTDTGPVELPARPEAVQLMPNEARQGVTHQNMRTVLAVGTIGCVAVMALVYLAFFA